MFRALLILAALAGLSLAPQPAAAATLEPASSQPLATALTPSDGSDFDNALSLRAAERAAIPAPPPTMQDVIAAAFAPLGPDAVNWAERIAWCESRYDPAAVNQESDAQGLFQFLPSTWRGTPQAAASPFDPAANAQAAVWLYQTYGPDQWACQA